MEDYSLTVSVSSKVFVCGYFGLLVCGLLAVFLCAVSGQLYMKRSRYTKIAVCSCMSVSIAKFGVRLF